MRPVTINASRSGLSVYLASPSQPYPRKKPTVQLQNTSVYILAYSGNVRNLSWVFFFRLWVQCSVVLCYPQYFFPPPQHLVLLSLINCKFHHSCFRIKLKFLSSVKRYFLPRMFRHFLSASSDIFRHSIFWISIFLQNLPTCRQNFNQPFN